MLPFFLRSLEAAMIFSFAGLGELVNQRSGVLNVGIEGIMLFGATVGFIAAQTTGSYVMGFAAGSAVGLLLGLLHAFFSITLRVDQVVSGMGIWIFGFGVTTYLGAPYAGPLGMERLQTVFGVSPFVYVAIAFTLVIWFILHRTSFGLSLRAVGETPAVADVSGINVTRLRYLAVTFGGLMGGFAGALYALYYNPVWNYNFLMGWGFISLALVFFSMWNPMLLFGGAVLFGLLWQLSLNPELLFAGLFSRYLWRTAPFIATMLILVVISTGWFRRRWGAARPEALGQPYMKE